MTRLQRRAGIIAAALATMAAVGALGASMATASAPPPCPPGTTCMTGKLLLRDPGSDTVSQILVEDKNGAPMLWVNVFGLYSGGEPVCNTGLDLQPRTCIGGAQGSYGGQALLTLYAGGRQASLDFAQLAWLDRWLARRGIR